MSKPGYTLLHSTKLSDIAGTNKTAPVVSLAQADTVEAALKTTDASGNQTLAARALALKPVSEILDASGRDPLVTLNAHNPVSMAAQIMAGGVHRTPVVDDADKCQFWLSQSDIVAFITSHLTGQLNVLASKTLAELKLGQQGVLAVGFTDPVITAMDAISTNGISAVAVVHHNGHLAGNFSVADLKGLYAEDSPNLTRSVKDYLESYHPESLNCITAVSSTTLKDLLKDVVESKVHRVWVLDADNKPAGVVSLRDIIDCVLETVV